MRESGATVNYTLKIHCNYPTSNDHCITFSESELNISLLINGTFSFFHTRKPTDDEIHLCEKISITPNRQHWNTYYTLYELNERSMLNYMVRSLNQIIKNITY